MVCLDLQLSLEEHTVFQREDLLCGWLFLTAWCLITSLPARPFFFLNHQQNVKQKAQISPQYSLLSDKKKKNKLVGLLPTLVTDIVVYKIDISIIM